MPFCLLFTKNRYQVISEDIMATFRSREDSGRGQVPLHHFQERVGAFRAMIHIIANRTELELRTLGKFQASLHKLVSLFSPLANECSINFRECIRRRKSTE